MDRVYDIMLSLGYPREAVDWLRERRTLTILILGALAWLPFIGIGWLLFSIFN